MIRLLWGCLLTVALLPVSAFAGDADEIRLLIPRATGMLHADYLKLVEAKEPKRADIVDQSLTLMLFTLKPKEDKKAKARFRFLGKEPPKPADLAREAYRTKIIARQKVLLLPITLIHGDRITNLTCDVKGDLATGTVVFEVPNLVAGSADYTARRKDGAWEIQEFALPEYDIQLQLNDKGKWQLKK